MRQPKIVRAIKDDHRRIQGDPNCRSLLEGVRSLRDDPCKVSVHLNILGEAAPFLVDATTKRSCDLIANLHRDAEVRTGLYDDPREVASEYRPWVGSKPGVYSWKCQYGVAPGNDERTLPVGRVDSNRGNLDKDFILANCWNRTHFCLDTLVCLDDDRSVGLRDFKVGHIESWFEFCEVEMCVVISTVLSEIVWLIYVLYCGVPPLCIHYPRGKMGELLTKQSQGPHSVD